MSTKKVLTWRDLLENPTIAPRKAAPLFSSGTLPRTRGDCTHVRTAKKPCPYWKCRHHVALDSDEMGVKLSWAAFHGPSCVLDMVEEREGVEDQKLPSGDCVYSANEIEDILGIRARSSFEVLHDHTVRLKFRDAYEQFLDKKGPGVPAKRLTLRAPDSTQDSPEID